jgi:hypothetical protein
MMELINTRSTISRALLLRELYRSFGVTSFRYKHIKQHGEIHGSGDTLTVKSLEANEWVEKIEKGRYRLTQKAITQTKELIEIFKDET